MVSGNTTIVTALYDLGRGSMKKEANNYRPFHDYLNWFKFLLELNCPMVIFVPPELVQFVKENRSKEYNTLIKSTKLEDLPLFKQYGTKAKEIIRSLPEKGIKLRNIELINHEYTLLIFSKFDMLNQVAVDNPFHSDYFLWVDAGYFRNKPTFNTKLLWPDPYKIQHLQDGRYLIQQSKKIDPSNESILKDPVRYLSTLPNDVIACIHGGNQRSVHKMYNDIKRWFKRMIEEFNLLNNEQQVMNLILYERWSDFLLYEPSKDNRQIINDFAQDTCISIGYPKCNKFIAIGVATREVSEKEIILWKKTADFYGYDARIIGRDRKWGGWKGRTALYIEECEKATEVQYIVLSDITDVIFVGPAYKAWNDISKLDNVLIGGESIMAYLGSKNRYEVENYFVKRGKSRFLFPNGGMLAGPKGKILEVLKLNSNSKDDQAGYMDLIMEDKCKINIDYDTVLFGNIPNYHYYTKLEKDFWLQPIRGHFTNPISGHSPSLLHFAGANFGIRNFMCDNVCGVDPNALNQTNKYWICYFGFFIIFILIIFVMLYFRLI